MTTVICWHCATTKDTLNELNILLLRLSVRVVQSSRAGMGKSLIVKHQAEQLKNLPSNKKLRKDLIPSLCPTVPVHGISVDSDHVTKTLLSHAVKRDIPVSRIFHLDMSQSVIKLLASMNYNVTKFSITWHFHDYLSRIEERITCFRLFSIGCCAFPCSALLCRVVLCCVVSCRVVLCFAVLCCVVFCCAVLCCVVAFCCLILIGDYIVDSSLDYPCVNIQCVYSFMPDDCYLFSSGCERTGQFLI